MIHPLLSPHISGRSLKVAARNERISASSQTMSYSKYSISVERITTTNISMTLYGNGTYLCTCVEDGDKSYLRHHSASNSGFSAHPELLSGRIWICGQPFLSLLIIPITIVGIAKMRGILKTVSLLHSSTSIVYAMSGFL